ncbi:MAG: hypothetical protein IKG55_01400 [Solobacterium sp.]|nr:hypothetical protein [Solobacterium sp.]
MALANEADANNDGEYSEEELNALTKAQIAALAAELGFEGVTTNLTKAEMIAAFLEAQEGGT